MKKICSYIAGKPVIKFTLQENLQFIAGKSAITLQENLQFIAGKSAITLQDNLQSSGENTVIAMQQMQNNVGYY